MIDNGEELQTVKIQLTSKFAESTFKREMTQSEFNTLMLNIERMVMSTGRNP